MPDRAATTTPGLELVSSISMEGQYESCTTCAAVISGTRRYLCSDCHCCTLCRDCYDLADDHRKLHQFHYVFPDQSIHPIHEAEGIIGDGISGGEVVKDSESSQRRVFDEILLHRRHACTNCGITPITGQRFHCYQVPNVNLCSPCYNLEAKMINGKNLEAKMINGKYSHLSFWRIACGRVQFVAHGSRIKGEMPEHEKAALIPPNTYLDFRCDLCRVAPVVGDRYQCTECFDYDLCDSCFQIDTAHIANHSFLRLGVDGVTCFYCQGGKIRMSALPPCFSPTSPLNIPSDNNNSLAHVRQYPHHDVNWSIAENSSSTVRHPSCAATTTTRRGRGGGGGGGEGSSSLFHNRRNVDDIMMAQRHNNGEYACGVAGHSQLFNPSPVHEYYNETNSEVLLMEPSAVLEKNDTYRKEVKREHSSSLISEKKVHHHVGVMCNVCDVSPITGDRYCCTHCFSYNLCAKCYVKEIKRHPKSHRFTKYGNSGISLLSAECQGDHDHDEAAANSAVHPTSSCTCCEMTPLCGPRFLCQECGKFDLCERCFDSSQHKTKHAFWRLGLTSIKFIRAGSSRVLPRSAVAPNTISGKKSDPTTSFRCGCCYASPIQGCRFQCNDCYDCSLCEACFLTEKEHQAKHAFFRVDKSTVLYMPAQAPLQHKCDLCMDVVAGEFFQCSTCPNYDLCPACFDRSHDHRAIHFFSRENVGPPSMRRRTRVSPSRRRHHHHSTTDPPSPQSVSSNPRTTCTGCSSTTEMELFRCHVCTDYNLCWPCYVNDSTHRSTHDFSRIICTAPIVVERSQMMLEQHCTTTRPPTENVEDHDHNAVRNIQQRNQALQPVITATVTKASPPPTVVQEEYDPDETF